MRKVMIMLYPFAQTCAQALKSQKKLTDHLRRFSAGVSAIATLLIAAPAMAHHPLNGQVPNTLIDGLLSGVSHPVIGFDHLAFILAVGLLAAVVRRGRVMPLAFLLAALAGTWLHVSAVSLPAAEIVISISVVVFGALATTRRSLNTAALVALTIFVGLFHGYAYGEAIVGAEPTPLVAYLIGFTMVQGAIAGVAYWLAERALKKNHSVGTISIHHAGFAIFGVGVAFLGNLFV